MVRPNDPALYQIYCQWKFEIITDSTLLIWLKDRAHWDFAWKKLNMGDKLALRANLSPIFTTYHGNSQRLKIGSFWR